MSTEIDFSGHYSFSVRIDHDELGDLGEATLQFGADHWPHLRFDDWRAYDRLGDEKKYDRLRAITKTDEVFTLFDCSVLRYNVSIDYIVAGDVKSQFKVISIRFDEINEWFMPFRSVEEKIASDAADSGRLQHIAVTVRTDEESFNLTTESIVRVIRQGEDHVVHEHVLFNFERIDELFSVEEIKRKAHELNTLLSILIAVPLYLVNVLVTCNDGKIYCAFFPSFKKKNQDSRERFWADYFITKPRLDDHWQKIFENYYRSMFRKISWVRLAGMQRYEGFWEYRALGYVSLLDKYVNQRTQGQTRPTSKR